MNKQIGIIGLGKMGLALAINLKSKGWDVIAYNRSKDKLMEAVKHGITAAETIEELCGALKKPSIIWSMVSAGEATKSVLFNPVTGVINYLTKGDFVIEGGNSFYKDDKVNNSLFLEKGINYLDVGVSGGPKGAKNGACLMIGGTKENFISLEPLFKDLSKNNSYAFFNGVGAGHFVKMVHNAIEYGFMQSIAEGFNVLGKSDFNFNLSEVASIYSNGSIIESKLIDLTKEVFNKYGLDLADLSSTVNSNGEVDWFLQTATELKLDSRVIEESAKFRKESNLKSSFTGKILTGLRNLFGGHSIN